MVADDNNNLLPLLPSTFRQRGRYKLFDKKPGLAQPDNPKASAAAATTGIATGLTISLNSS